MVYESYSELLKATAELEEYSELCGDELGEYWMKLVEMANSSDTGMSDEFEAAYQKEVAAQLAYIKENVKVVEHTDTREITNTYKELEWN